MAKAYKLERLVISDASRTVKDWFPTRESADAAIPTIRAHLIATGEAHTCPCHTHTRPPADAAPVYIGAFELPDRMVKAKHFAPCPCCWDETPKFGHGKIAWFPDERVIRLIGPDCFKRLNPEAHDRAQTAFDIEQERKRNTDFLISNLPRLREVISVLSNAIAVAEAIETVHADLIGKLAVAQLNLWQHVRRNGELSVTMEQQEFRRGVDGEMYSQTVVVPTVYAQLSGYEMLDPAPLSISSGLKAALEKIKAHSLAEDFQATVDAMDDKQRREVAETLSRTVKKAKEKIARTEILRKFTERVEINTLRNWAAQEGCPITLYCSHDGDSIAFGKRQHNTVNVRLPDNISRNIGAITFWTERAAHPR